MLDRQIRPGYDVNTSLLASQTTGELHDTRGGHQLECDPFRQSSPFTKPHLDITCQIMRNVGFGVIVDCPEIVSDQVEGV